MCTVRSSSRLLGEGGESASARPLNLPPRYGPGAPPPARPLNLPLGYSPGDPPGQTPPPNLPLGIGLETLPQQTPQLPLWVWAWRPPQPDPSTSPLGMGLETPPADRMIDTCKKITFTNFVCGWWKWSFQILVNLREFWFNYSHNMKSFPRIQVKVKKLSWQIKFPNMC